MGVAVLNGEWRRTKRRTHNGDNYSITNETGMSKMSSAAREHIGVQIWCACYLFYRCPRIFEGNTSQRIELEAYSVAYPFTYYLFRHLNWKIMLV